MKRTIFFLYTLLIGISGAWAQVTTEGFTASYSASTASTGTFLTNQSWKSSGTHSMTMTCSGSQAFNTTNGYIFAGTYTLSVEEGYVITGYSITGHCAWNGINGDVERITPATGTITDGDGNTVTHLDFAGSDVTLNVSDVNSSSVSFTMTKTVGGNGAFAATDITITARKEMVDRGLYTISFVSYDDNTKTWGLSSSGTTASVTADATGSTFVAHKYTNESGATRWIFVNNADGYYLAYHAATKAFNISEPINEFAVSNLTKGGNVKNDADCTDKVFLVADQRTDNTSLGCYILKEENGAFDKSTAPFYNGKYTSALYLSPVEATISDAAALAIAKFDALYAVKPYVPEGGNMSVLFASSSVTSLETDINAQTTIEGAASKAETFLRSAEGKKFYAVSASDNGRYLNVESERVTATNTSLTAVAVMQAEYAGNGKFYLKGIFNNRYICTPHQDNVAPATTSNKAEAATFYIGNYDNTTDNKVYFATSKKAADTTGDCEAIHYSANYANHTCGWDYNAGASQWIITAVSDDEYIELAKSIEQTLNYSLTDANGATYSGTYEGFLTTTVPTFTGCTGYTLTNGSWDVSTKTYSATINFPFAISSNNVENITYISSFHNKSDYSPKDFLWHANGTSVTVHYQDVPNNTKSEGVYTDEEKYEWAIFPAIADNNITFTIKNVSTGTFINNTTTGSNHNAGTVTLSETATPVQYATGSTDNCGTIYKWYIPSTSNYLSVNDVDGGTNQELGVHETDHDGLSIGFHTPTDFATLDANLLAACIAFMPYNALIGSEYGQYSGDTSADMCAAYLAATTQTLTEAQITSYTNTLENPSTKLTLNVPQAGDFLRIKASATNKAAYSTSSDLYLTSSNTQSDVNNNAYKDKRVGFVEGAANDNTTIFYYDGSYLTGFANGLQPMNNNDNQLQIGAVGASTTKITFESIESTEAKAFRIEFNNGGRSLYTQRHSGVYFTDAAGGNATDAHYRYFLEKVTSLPVTISAAGYATFNSPVAVEIPQGVTAYVATDKGEYLTLTAIEGGVIPANTGVILKGGEGTYNFDITTGGSEKDNVLTGTVAAITRPDGSYILSTGAKGVGFYGDGAEIIPGFKSYLPKAAVGVRGFLGFNFDDPTAITAVEAAMNAGKTIYDLSGRRVENPVSGLYIVNGMKVFINKK